MKIKRTLKMIGAVAGWAALWFALDRIFPHGVDTMWVGAAGFFAYGL